MSTQAPVYSTLDKVRVALAGNPNCGKTSLFNALTGLRYKVANYPGVTVEKKSGKLQADHKVEIIDLPGIYSVVSTSIDEKISSLALFGGLANEPKPDIIVSVVDASNLERNLYLTTQLIDLGMPVILALNMIDLAKKNGIQIKKELLSRLLGVPVVEIIASDSQGIEQLISEIKNVRTSPIKSSAWLPTSFQQKVCSLGQALRQVESNYELQSLTDFFIGSFAISEQFDFKDSRTQNILKEYISQPNINPSFEASARYSWINKISKKVLKIKNQKDNKFLEKFDQILTHKLWGSLIFILIISFIFQAIFTWASVPMDWIDSAFQKLSQFVSSIMPDGEIKSLFVDGVIPGVGSVVIFIPQIAILFFFLGILEDSGYLSRAAFMMDKIMRKFGLQGRSFIPLLSSFACAIPGIMSTRSIPSFSDRLTTILVAPLMSCSARIPVYTVLISAFVPQTFLYGFISLQGLVLLGMYLLGIFGAAIVAKILRFSIFKGQPALFVMEMPVFKKPSLKLVIRDVIDRIVLFIKNAGTMILACSIILWFLASYPKVENQTTSNPVASSYAGQIGHFIEPVIKPLGFNWEIGVGLLASFAAREVFVSALATVYSLQEDDDGAHSLIQVLKDKKNSQNNGYNFSTLAAISLMVFYVFACQCISTLAVVKRETGSWKWVIFMFSYMTLLAYFASLITYQLGSLWQNLH